MQRKVRNFVIEGVACQPPSSSASHSSITNFLKGKVISSDSMEILLKIRNFVIEGVACQLPRVQATPLLQTSLVENRFFLTLF